MKRVLLAALLAAAMTLSPGCVSIEAGDAAPQSPAPAAVSPAKTDEPGAVSTPGAADTPAPAGGASAANTVTVGLAAYFPWERIPLPEGSEFVKAEGVEDTDNYVEYTYVRLPMTKSEAVAYFEPLLQQGAEYYIRDDDLPYPPLEIQGMYPEAVSFTSLYARYAEQDVSLINVSLYTPEDGETLLIAQIQVNYPSKP